MYLLIKSLTPSIFHFYLLLRAKKFHAVSAVLAGNYRSLALVFIDLLCINYSTICHIAHIGSPYFQHY